jgi:hypothetical protein
MITKMKLTLVHFLLVISVLIGTQKSYGQELTPQKKEKKNSIKINLTNPMLFGKDCYILGYERTIGHHQSFTVNIGRFALPKLISIGNDSIKQLNSNTTTSRGLSLSADYRFYLSKENKYNSPRGVYIGPYFASNGYSRNFELEAIAGEYIGKLNADLKLNITTLGVQLGYQFLFWEDRISLDMMMFGPGFSFYKVKASLDTSLSSEKESELFQKINDALAAKIPGYSLVVQPGEFQKTGSFNTTNLGFRYVMMVGFRF